MRCPSLHHSTWATPFSHPTCRSTSPTGRHTPGWYPSSWRKKCRRRPGCPATWLLRWGLQLCMPPALLHATCGVQVTCNLHAARACSCARHLQVCIPSCRCECTHHRGCVCLPKCLITLQRCVCASFPAPQGALHFVREVLWREAALVSLPWDRSAVAVELRPFPLEGEDFLAARMAGHNPPIFNQPCRFFFQLNGTRAMCTHGLGCRFGHAPPREDFL